MTDRELLDLAAKAAGIKLYWPDADTYDEGVVVPAGPLLPNWRVLEKVYWDEWNPLLSDGDALRLAVKLGMQIDTRAPEIHVYVLGAEGRIDECHAKGNSLTATRLAITRAAAEIGRTMK